MPWSRRRGCWRQRSRRSRSLLPDRLLQIRPSQSFVRVLPWIDGQGQSLKPTFDAAIKLVSDCARGFDALFHVLPSRKLNLDRHINHQFSLALEAFRKAFSRSILTLTV